jgi:hypothetical protein
MLSPFKIFALNKSLLEMYGNLYLPYCLNEAEEKRTGGGRKREVAAKGAKIEAADADREFVKTVKDQVGAISYHKILMVYFQLLGKEHDKNGIRPRPTDPEGKGNKAFAWIKRKSDPDENGNVHVTITFVGSGDSKKDAHATVNLEAFKKRIIEQGYDLNDPAALSKIINRTELAWRKNIQPDKKEGSKYGFDYKGFTTDYHATQVAESPTFKKRFDSDKEFADKIAEMAVKAAASATGISVATHGGFNYKIKSLNSRKFPSISESDLDDAIQSAISYMSSQSATEPEKLNDTDWLRTKLATGARNHIRTLVDSKERAVGSQNTDTRSKGLDMDNYSRDDDPVSDDHEDNGDPSYNDDEHDEEEPVEEPVQTALAKFNPHLMTRKIPIALPDAKPDAYSYSSHDEDPADAEDMKKYRRRMNAESFLNYVNLKEATSAIYDGTKEKDFQWEGKPNSMIKMKRKLR